MALVPGALAEEEKILNALDLTEFERAGEAAGIQVMDVLGSLLSGDLTAGLNALSALFAQVKGAVMQDLQGVAWAFLTPMAVSVMLRLVLGREGTSQRAIQFVCRASVIAALSASFVRLSGVASALMAQMMECSDALAPAIIAATALSGAESTAAALTPMSGLCADLIQNILGNWGLALCSGAAAVAIAGNLSGSIHLKRLHGLFRQLLNWMAGLMMAAFMGALSLQGKLSSPRDGVAAQTARYAIESIVPVIGGNVSDSLDSLLSTAAVVRNALGISGLVVLCAVCLTPLCRLAGMSLALKLFSAVLEPLGDGAMTSLTSQFADAVEMLLVVCVVGAVLCAMLTGSCMNAVGSLVR